MRAALTLALALSLAGCAAGPHNGGDAAATPTMRGTPVVLSNANLPPQGSNYRGSDGKWQVHGVINQTVYRYGEQDRAHLLVAAAPTSDWTSLSARNSWTVGCYAIAPVVHCAIEAPPLGNSGSARNLAMVDDFVCRMESGTPNLPPNEFVQMNDGRSCIAVSDPAQTRRQLQSFYGFNAAVTLREWIVRIYQTGRAK